MGQRTCAALGLHAPDGAIARARPARQEGATTGCASAEVAGAPGLLANVSWTIMTCLQTLFWSCTLQGVSAAMSVALVEPAGSRASGGSSHSPCALRRMPQCSTTGVLTSVTSRTCTEQDWLRWLVLLLHPCLTAPALN